MNDHEYVGIQIMLRVEPGTINFDIDADLDGLHAALGCTCDLPEGQDDNCPIVAMASTQGTEEQVSQWLYGPPDLDGTEA